MTPRRTVILSEVAAPRSEAATQSKDLAFPDTADEAVRVERTLLSAAFDLDLDFSQTKPRAPV